MTLKETTSGWATLTPLTPATLETRRDVPVEGYPSLRVAAALVGVHVSTLSRRDDVVRIPAGREDRVPAAEVVRLTAEYGKRRLSRVAGELVERVVGADEQEDIAREVDEALELYARTPVVLTSQAFLADARRLLPRHLVAQIEATLKADPGGGRSSVGWSPPGA